jgi:hypothetical protein
VSQSFPRRLARLGLPVVAVVAALAIATAAQAGTPIGPDQGFGGFVNGSAANATIHMACFGPNSPGETGHPMAGNYVYASQILPPTNSAIGFTGAAGRAITVSIVVLTPTGQATAVSVGTLTSYDTKLPIPITVTLPCYGSGTTIFTPTPTSANARSATVVVQFVGQP